jgi:cysteine-rich repeat protein
MAGVRHGADLARRRIAADPAEDERSPPRYVACSPALAMKSFMRFGVCAIAAAHFGCGISMDEGESPGTADPADAPGAAEARLRLTFHAGDAALAPDGAFATKDAVHLRAAVAGGSAALAGVDLAFVVLDVRGAQVSSDALDCRRFRLGPAGEIEEVYPGFDASGAPCQHAAVVHDSGALLPRLAPFADVAPNADGVMEYTVLVAPIDQVAGDTFPTHALRGTFLVEAGPVCGNGQVDDGEGCDDGNTTSGDGCSATCETEGGHCGGEGDGPVCGNGVVEAGETCDDGNTTPGDGCSPYCLIEVIL